MHDVHCVHTPEHVVFEFELAGLATRALGMAIDVCVMATLVGFAATVCSVFGLVLAGFAKALYFVAIFAIQWGYGAVLEWRWHGQTVGKRFLGTRVLSSNGLSISFGQAAVRNLLRALDILPGGYLLGGASVLLDARARRFGDIVADTVVVRAGSAAQPADTGVELQRYNSLADDMSSGQVARAITAREREIAWSLAARRETLPLAVRHDLFSKLAKHLERRFGLRRPGFLSQERFVLNLMEIAEQAVESSHAVSKQRHEERR